MPNQYKPLRKSSILVLMPFPSPMRLCVLVIQHHSQSQQQGRWGILVQQGMKQSTSMLHTTPTCHLIVIRATGHWLGGPPINICIPSNPVHKPVLLQAYTMACPPPSRIQRRWSSNLSPSTSDPHPTSGENHPAHMLITPQSFSSLILLHNLKGNWVWIGIRSTIWRPSFLMRTSPSSLIPPNFLHLLPLSHSKRYGRTILSRVIETTTLFTKVYSRGRNQDGCCCRCRGCGVIPETTRAVKFDMDDVPLFGLVN